MAAVDDGFIRRAVELADLAAVKVALYQGTGDPWVRDLPPVPQLSDEQREQLIDRAVDYLRELPADATLATPSEAELRELMTLATGVGMTDEEFAARRDLAAFEERPWTAQWPGGERPELPAGFTVAIIGAGFSGIAAAHQMQQLGIPYTVYERRNEVGGVWSINQYPDARVDTLSSIYEYNFEKNYPWSEYFARQPEVRGYIEHVAKKHGMWDHIRFEHDLQLAEWDEATSTWRLSFGRPDGTTYRAEANAVVTGCGVFANPRPFDIEGKDDYEGRIVHPTRWSPDIEVKGATVAVVGNGSTGVQIVSPLAKDAKQLYVFQRTAQWISPRPKYGAPIEAEVRWLLDTMPGYWNWARYTATATLFNSHELMVPDPEWQAKGGLISEKNDAIRTALTQYMRAQLGGDEALLAKVMPDYAPMTRRPVVDNGWYAALTRDNVELVTDRIRRLVPSGIETDDGKVRDIDVIVTATGFDIVRYLQPAEFVGVGGVRLEDRWAADGPRAYVGMMVPDFPNMFMLYGPNSQPVSGGTSLPGWYQIWSRYVAQCLMGMLERGCSRVTVTHDAHDSYNEALDAEAARLIMMSDEPSVKKNYYVNAEKGRLQMNTPFESPVFFAFCDKPDWTQLELDQPR